MALSFCAALVHNGGGAKFAILSMGLYTTVEFTKDPYYEAFDRDVTTRRHNIGWHPMRALRDSYLYEG
jgi:hypothetical protein